MGTRNLTAVFKDGEYKVAQYGQWDGYPSGVGVTVLSFLHTLKEKIYMKQFLAKLDTVSFLTDDDISEINEKIDSGEISSLNYDFPELSRDTGGDILKLISMSEKPLKLQNGINFAADSLFCEYAYVVDFDKGVFEVYEGFNKSPLSDGERFYGYARDGRENEYEPVKLVRSYHIDELPTVDQFVDDLEQTDDSEG